MTPAQIDRLTRAVALLGHIEGRTKKDARAIEMLGSLLREMRDGVPVVEREPLPKGCVEGRQNVRPGDWVK